MNSKREQAMVGSFVLVAAGVLVGTVVALTGAFGGPAKTYRAYFQFAGGLEPGATVRYAGGPSSGDCSWKRDGQAGGLGSDSAVRTLRRFQRAHREDQRDCATSARAV